MKALSFPNMVPSARLAGFCALFLGVSPVSAGLISGTGIFVKDSGGSQRVQYSNNERITLTARINNAVASANRVQFTFRIAGPTGAEVFLHGGNSVPGTVGNSASQVSGIPISQFFTGPGLYSFTATAVLDAQTVSQNITFAVSSPNIILIYPPNGARDVADRPVTFRWSASGAARYRVTVGDNPAVYNAVFAESTAGPESFLAYPDNPGNSLARLGAGTVYYWKVEGLDAAGNVIAQSEAPYNFTAQTAALTRDLSVTELEATGREGLTLNFRVRVANQGGTTESNVPLRFSLGGLPAPGSPLALPQLRPGDSREYPFNAALPTDQGQSLAIACVEFFDDSVPNNCKTIQVTKPTDSSGDSGFGQGGFLSKEQLWEALKQKLIEIGWDFDEYEAAEMSQQLSAADMQALLDQLAQGLVQISLSGPPIGTPPPPTFIPPPVSAPPSGAPPPPPPAKPDETWAALQDKLLGLGVDLSDYEVVGMEGDLTTEELEALLDQLAKGTAQVSVSGPPPGTGPPPTVIPPPVSAKNPASPPPVAVPSQNAVGREFAGIAVSDFGEKGLYSVARDAKSFGRVWARLSQSEAPDFDFKQVMVVVLVAGTKADAERVEVEDVMEGLDGLIVRYRVVGKGPNVRLPGAPRRRGVPFMVKVVRASGLEAKFDDLGRGGR